MFYNLGTTVRLFASELFTLEERTFSHRLIIRKCCPRHNRIFFLSKLGQTDKSRTTLKFGYIKFVRFALELLPLSAKKTHLTLICFINDNLMNFQIIKTRIQS